MKKIIQMIKNARAKRLQKIEKWLFAYLSRRYEVMNYGKVAIPHFMQAEKEIAELKKRGLLEITYKQIRKGVKVIC